jgi:CBS domain containing-hemolysin-like protein
MLLKVILLVVCLLLSAFFSASEIALISLSRLKIQQLVEKKKKNALLVKRLRDNTHKLLITVLIGNNLVNVSASIITMIIGTELFYRRGFTLTQSEIGGIVTGVITLIILVFGEIFPKTIATTYAESIALALAKPIDFVVFIFSPVSWFLDKVNRFFFFVLRIKPKTKPSITEEELRYFTATGAREGTIKEREKVYIHNIFRFDDIAAKEVMTPRPNITAIELSTPKEDIIRIIEESEYSRIPVYRKRMDNIVGVLYTKDLINSLSRNPKIFSLKRILGPAIFVPENKKIDEIFRLMQRKKQHIVFVVSEFGGVSGLITMEDLLEEIMGEIYDETDSVHELIRKTGRRQALVDGGALLEDVNEELGLSLELKNQFVTIGGFILDRLGRIPARGETLKVEGGLIEIRKVTNKRIVQVKITKK